MNRLPRKAKHPLRLSPLLRNLVVVVAVALALSLTACTTVVRVPATAAPTPTATADLSSPLGELTMTAPKTLDGLPRIPNSQLDSVASKLKANYGPVISSVFYAAYGRGAAPSLLFMGMTSTQPLGPEGGSVTGPYLDGILNGFNNSSGQHLSTADAIQKTVKGHGYTCFPITLNAMALGMCLWIDSNVLGVVIDVRGESLDQVAELADNARKAAQS